MVYLSKIYTKTGDGGTTLLGNSDRVSKDNIRVEAIGAVDELNATVGLLLVQIADSQMREALLCIANDLFDMGADLCVPISADERTGVEARLRIATAHVGRLEKWIDEWNASLPALTSFVLRGGTPAAAFAHLACTICRRAERRLVALMHAESINSLTVVYLNRLSDLLFVLARVLNDNGKNDILWQPGRGLGR